MWVPVCSERMELTLTGTVFCPFMRPRGYVCTGGRGDVRLRARPGLWAAPGRGRTRATVRRGRADVGAGRVWAVPGCGALVAAVADAVDAGGAVADAELVWGVLSAQTQGERRPEGAAAPCSCRIRRTVGRRAEGRVPGSVYLAYARVVSIASIMASRFTVVSTDCPAAGPFGQASSPM